MRTIKFARGLEFKAEGNTMMLKRLVEGVWQCENQRTGAFETFSISTLNQLYATGRLEFLVEPVYTTKFRNTEDDVIEGYLNNMKVEDREYIVGKRYFLVNYQTNYGGLKTQKMMDLALDRDWTKACPNTERPSSSAALKWLTKFEKAGNDIRSLFPRYNQCGNRKKRIHEEVEIVCTQAINEYYMTREMHTMTFVLNKAMTSVDHENKKRPKALQLPLPSISTLRSILKNYSAEEIFTSRRGAEAARNKYRTSIGSSYAEGPLSVVEIDHTRLDVIAVDELTGLAIDRPWLTVVMDRFSKCVLGIHLSYEPPSHATVAAALKHAIMPKVLHESTQGSWPMHGIPMLLVVDNGLEFHGQALKVLCAEIGISISFCPRKKGWAKGSVERVIGTINRNISELVPSGRTFHSVKERGDYDSVGKASVSLEAIRLCAEKYIVDIYHDTFHRGINGKPIDKWKTYINDEDIRLPINPGEFDAISGNIDTRKVFHYGIEINNATYNCTELMKYRDSFKTKATVRWSCQDLGQIHVMIPNGPRIEVPVHPSKDFLKGMSLYTWKVIQSDMRSSEMDLDNKVVVARRVQEIQELMDENAKKNKQTRLRHIRFRDGTKRPLPLMRDSIPKPEQDILKVEYRPSLQVPKMKVSERINSTEQGSYHGKP